MRPTSGVNPWLAALGVFALVLVTYGRIWMAGFIWDDDAHVTPLALRSAHGLWRIWFEPGATQQYYPLLHSFFWLEHRVWGDDPTAYHLVNLALHSIVAILLALTLRRLGVRAAWAAALIFAVHPVMAESVAWISEQKNTLSAALYFGATLAYLRFDTGRHARAYAVALVFFALALTAKTVTSTLPAALLVVFWWQRGSLSWRRDVVPLIPWFALATVAGATTAWMERTSIGASGEAFALGGVERLLIASRAIWFYLAKLLAPTGLVFIYPRWEIERTDWVQYLPLLALIVVTGIAWKARRRSRSPLAVLLLYAGTLFPALGFIDVFPFQYSFVADHFQYLAAPVVIAGIVAGLAGWLERRGPPARTAGFTATAATIVLLSALTCRTSARFADSETLWRDTIERNPGCWMARNNLGADLLQAGRMNEAIPLIESAVTLAPRNPAGRINLGEVRLLQGNAGAAIVEFHQAVDVAPANAEAHADLASALLQTGDRDEAATQVEDALRLRPGFAKAWTVRGNLDLASGRTPEAFEAFGHALALDPIDSSARSNRGMILAQQGKFNQAIIEFQQAARTDSNNGSLQLNLANALLQAGRPVEALASYRRAVELQPESGVAHRSLALALLQAGRSDEAETQFRAALAVDPRDRESHRQLGAILYRRGDLDAARGELEQAGPVR